MTASGLDVFGIAEMATRKNVTPIVALMLFLIVWLLCGKAVLV